MWAKHTLILVLKQVVHIVTTTAYGVTGLLNNLNPVTIYLYCSCTFTCYDIEHRHYSLGCRTFCAFEWLAQKEL